ncbi:MAG: hypothetical protein K6C12_09495 [Oscillospiraceae bacterium]|nr:hypothetical protein [Oscillospiraceae bacterium]
MDKRENNEAIIRCACPLFACRICRTKTGWPHQLWCEISGVTEPGCTDCRYHNPEKSACAHPARKAVHHR